jgi:hypothetical protein
MAKRLTKEEKNKRPNHKSWMKKCDEVFMVIGRDLTCAVCDKEDGICYHHIIPKSRSKHLRYDLINVIPLCKAHHTMGGDMAAHSTNSFAVVKFVEWLEENEPHRVKYCKENEHVKAFWTYKDMLEELEKLYK